MKRDQRKYLLISDSRKYTLSISSSRIMLILFLLIAYSVCGLYQSRFIIDIAPIAVDPGDISYQDLQDYGEDSDSFEFLITIEELYSGKNGINLYYSYSDSATPPSQNSSTLVRFAYHASDTYTVRVPFYDIILDNETLVEGGVPTYVDSFQYLKVRGTIHFSLSGGADSLKAYVTINQEGSDAIPTYPEHTPAEIPYLARPDVLESSAPELYPADTTKPFLHVFVSYYAHEPIGDYDNKTDESEKIYVGTIEF